MLPYIHILNRDIGTYGLIAMIAASLCGVLFMIGLKKRKIMIEDGIFFLMYVLLGVVIGSHLLYAITQYHLLPYLFQKVELTVWFERAQRIFGGSVFYGGLIGGIGSGYLGLKILKQDISVYSDLLAPIVPLFHGIARIGCFFAGCCYGIPCEWGITVDYNSIIPEMAGVARFPIQLVEAICNLILASALLFLLLRSQRHPILSGNLFKIYLIAYGIIRFSDEFLRGDAYRGFLGIFSTSQWVSLVIVSISTILLFRAINTSKKEKGLLYSNCNDLN